MQNNNKQTGMLFMNYLEHDALVENGRMINITEI